VSVCEFCGIAGVNREVYPVEVKPLRPSAPDVGTLRLCKPCRTKPNRVWRRRWQPV
jgi:hypothetical protein